MMTRFIRNTRGQVAIFIALMFQVLFLFFAMIVNVGLLVHHKINLQNSVDLAAYYGASKQAEVLNAIAHVNYQIRQSWKLLVWRQKVLGTAGIDPMSSVFPYGKLMSNGAVGEQLAGSALGNKGTKVFRLPTFCLSYAPHEIGGYANPTENSCRYMYDSQVVNLPPANILYIPDIFKNFGTQVAQAITQAANQAFDRCADVGALNFLMGGKFISAHYLDSNERAYLINYLATGLSVQIDNFYELSGDEVKIGLGKTLKKNLTDANNSTVQFEVFNSLASDSCKNSSSSVENTPQWLVPINVYPIWRYMDCIANNDASSGKIQMESRQLVNNNLPTLLNQVTKQALKDGVNTVAPNLPIRATLVGFEKDPWCVPYVGVRATAKPKIPFMPLSDVEITAEAYAKPFGGRIGPWYVKDWPQAVNSAGRLSYKANVDSADQVETIGGVRVSNVSGITGISDPAWAPNIARFAGDMLGFSSEMVLAYFHKAILGKSYPSLSPTPDYPFPILPQAQDNDVSLRYYETIAADYLAGDNMARDQLTWDSTSQKAPRERLLEIAAIAPTIFDLSYYSVEPDFYNNYYLPIEKHIDKRGGWKAEHVLLGDYGWRYKDPKAEKMNIMDQIKIQRDVGAVGALNSDVSMPYVVKKSSHLLNSWAVDSLLDYTVNNVSKPGKFGRCYSPSSDVIGTSGYETPMNPPAPGNCVDGGRVGYSVKLVSKEWLKATDLELGGSGLTGAARNPPPPSW